MGSRSIQKMLGTRTGMAVALTLIALVSAALYLPAARYGFVWDDKGLITENSLLANSRPTDIFLRGFWAGSREQVAGPYAPYYRPLVTLSFWLDQRLSGNNPHWFHTVNLLLYAMTAAVVTLVLWELLHSGVWALLGGLLFATHSSHVESVAFISGRTDILLTLFAGIAAFALLRSFRTHNRWWWLAIPPAFGLALLSKETAIVFPLLAMLAPLLVGARYDRRYWLLMVATMTVLASYLVLRAVAVPMAIPLQQETGISGRLASIVNTFGLYIRMFFWPFKHHAWYQASSSPSISVLNVAAALLFLIPAPLLALSRRFTTTLWGYAWTALFLLPAASTVMLGPLAAERLLLLPSAGIVMILTTVLCRVVGSQRSARWIAGACLAAVIVLLGIDSVMRTRVWENNETLFSAMVREAPTAPNAYSSLADEIAEVWPDSALALHYHALRVDSNYVHAHLHAAVLLSSRGDLRDAIQHLLVARRLMPNSNMVLNNLALAFSDSGEVDSALAMIDRAIEVQHGGSAALHLNRANVLVAAGRASEAEKELRRALALDSAVLWARTMLADMLGQRGRYDSAIALMEGEVRYRPSAPSFSYLGDLFVGKGDTSRAERSYDQALRLDPKYFTALFNLAALSAARGNLAAALPLAERAYRLRPDVEATRRLYQQITRRPSNHP